MPNLHNDPFDLAHFNRVEQNVKKIEKLYKALIDKISGLASSVQASGKPFSFADYPALKKQADKLFSAMAGSIITGIANGNEQEWKLAEKKMGSLVASVASKTKLPESVISEYSKQNLTALNAFQNRVSDGMKLSDRVWNYTDQFRREIEMGLDIGIGEGKSAAALSRDLRTYLNDPDKLFRRVRDKHGNLQLSKNAENYHPGQGVYRSSYKNAARLTRSENNIAYHEASYEKYQQFDFVIGIEVRLSNNPLHCPFCAEMAGKYPKDFKFWGWHPQCRCTTVPILKDWEEMEAENLAKTDSLKSDIILRPNQKFMDWIQQNQDKIERAKVKPYFVQNNQKYISAGPKTKVYSMANDSRPKLVKPLKEFNGSLQEFFDKIAKDFRTSNEVKILGELQPEIVKDLKSKGIELDNRYIAITDKKLAKYIDHAKSVKGASISLERFSEVEKTIANPASIYEDIKMKDILYVYSFPYEENKLIKLVIHPNFIVQGNTINLLKSIGIIEDWHFENTMQFIKLK